MLNLTARECLTLLLRIWEKLRLKMKKDSIYLFTKKASPTAVKGKAVIMAGQVYVDNQKADKCGSTYDENAKISRATHRNMSAEAD